MLEFKFTRSAAGKNRCILEVIFGTGRPFLILSVILYGDDVYRNNDHVNNNNNNSVK